MEEGRVLPSNFDKLVVLQVVEGGVNGESSIDCVLPLSQAVVGIENTTSGQNFKCKLCARVHIQEQLDWAVENNDDLIVDLLLGVLIHSVEHATFLFYLLVAHVGQLHKNFLRTIRKVVNLAEGSGQKELQIIIVDVHDITLEVPLEVREVSQQLIHNDVIDAA